jgi:hypothetical protein
MIILLHFVYILIALSTLLIEGGSWTAPGYSVAEEWRINPYDYIQESKPVTAYATTVEDENGCVWKLVLIDDENAYIFICNNLTETIPYEFTAEIIKFSPNAEFVVMYDIYSDRCARLDLVSGDLSIFSPFETPVLGEGYRYPKIKVTDSGSIIALHSRNLRIYDRNLNLTFTRDDHYFTNSSISCSDDGVLVCVTNRNLIEAFTESGNPLWSVETSLFPVSSNQYGEVYVSPSGNYVYATINNNTEILCLDGVTGQELESFEVSGTILRDLKFSSNNAYLAFNSVVANRSNPETTSCSVLQEACRSDNETNHQNSFTYSRDSNVWLHYPLALSNNGIQIYFFSNTGGYLKYILYSENGECIYCTDWFGFVVTENTLHFDATLKDDGSGFCYGDSNTIIFCAIERV